MAVVRAHGLGIDRRYLTLSTGLGTSQVLNAFEASVNLYSLSVLRSTWSLKSRVFEGLEQRTEFFFMVVFRKMGNFFYDIACV